MTITLYGIPNCDTVKKARTWLSDHNIDFTFHDFKKLGLDRATAALFDEATTISKPVSSGRRRAMVMGSRTPSKAKIGRASCRERV